MYVCVYIYIYIYIYIYTQKKNEDTVFDGLYVFLI